MVSNATFNSFKLYRGVQFYLWRKPEYLEKTTDLSQATDKLNYILFYRVHTPRVGLAFTTLVAQALIAQVVVNPTTLRSRRPLKSVGARKLKDKNIIANVDSYYLGLKKLLEDYSQRDSVVLLFYVSLLILASTTNNVLCCQYKSNATYVIAWSIRNKGN